MRAATSPVQDSPLRMKLARMYAQKPARLVSDQRLVLLFAMTVVALRWQAYQQSSFCLRKIFSNAKGNAYAAFWFLTWGRQSRDFEEISISAAMRPCHRFRHSARTMARRPPAAPSTFNLPSIAVGDRSPRHVRKLDHLPATLRTGCRLTRSCVAHDRRRFTARSSIASSTCRTASTQSADEIRASARSAASSMARLTSNLTGGITRAASPTTVRPHRDGQRNSGGNATIG